MDECKYISSVHNPLVKKVVLLKEKSRERQKSQTFVLEGMRELQLAIKGNYEPLTVLFLEEVLPNDTVKNLLATSGHSPELISVSKEVYQKMAYREGTEGIICIVKSKTHSLQNITFATKNPLVLVAQAPEKPGNLGALLRTADAAVLDAVIIADPNGDLYNPNVVRASVGCLFTRQLATGTTSEVIAFLKKHAISICCAALSSPKNYLDVDFVRAMAIVVGTESTGLTAEWLENSDQNIVIPMKGEIDSMNVSVSAAIIIFEAKRQRRQL